MRAWKAEVDGSVSTIEHKQREARKFVSERALESGIRLNLQSIESNRTSLIG